MNRPADIDVAAIVTRMKNGARGSPWVPLGVAPRERYHHLPNGLSLCLTLDILTEEYVSGFFKMIGEASGGGGEFWHLSIARPGGGSLTPEEVEFWPRAFFEEEPVMEMPGMLPGVKSRHFFWRAE